MTVINHSEVALGSRHAPHNLQYTNAANRVAGTNEASGIVLSSANIGQIAKQTDNNSFWILLLHSPIVWTRIFEGGVITTVSGEDLGFLVHAGGYLKYHLAPVVLVDDGSFDLPNSCGNGRISAGPVTGLGTVECLHIAWDNQGNVTDLGSSTNTAITDSDTFLCAFDNGANQVTIRNRLGASKSIIFELNYYEPIVV